jgi:hypothetical protein
MSRGIIYRLKNGNPNSWALKQKEVGITVPGQGFRYIQYYEGASSIFVDDNTDRKSTKIIFFLSYLIKSIIFIPK